MTEKEILNFSNRCKEDPAFFFKEVINLPSFEFDGKKLTHWTRQMEIVESVRDKDYTFVQSGHAIGKTYVTASIVLWFLFSHYESIVVTTAPTARQVEELLWAEVSKQYRDVLGGKMSHLKLDLGEGLRTKEGNKVDWKAIGFTAREATDHEKMASRMQGFHAPHMLVIFDEAFGVHPAFWVAKEGLLTSGHCRFLAIGNPTAPSGEFYQGCLHHGSIKISCLQHPNIIADEELIVGAVTQKWIEARKSEWGEQSSLYRSRVLGEFPDEGIDTLIPMSLVTKAIERATFKEFNIAPRSIGVDVARHGDDKTVLTFKIGRNVEKIVAYHGKDITWTIGTIKKIDEFFLSDSIVIDDTGVGGGVTDGLKGYKRKGDGKSPKIIPINNACSPEGNIFPSVEFENIKAEIYWSLKFDFENENIKLLDETRLVSDIVSIKYDFTPKSKIFIISKKDMKKQGFKSPDYADSLALANYGTKKRLTKKEDLIVQNDSTIVGNITSNDF